MKFPYGFTLNFCDWETIETTGSINSVYDYEQEENGCITVKYHWNTQNVRGVGPDTGDE